ncbi:MAG: DUF6338 family protein [Planctomycetaceae bacterium]|jgi:hypothetical protein|nr:DUF6338 family protein [Planctomycetaceae bacterium]
MFFDSLFNAMGVWQLLSIAAFIIFPGLVAMRMYRLAVATEKVDWQNAVIESTFWGTVNLLFASPMVYFGIWFFGGIRLDFLFIFLVATSIAMPLIWIQINKFNCVNEHILSYHPTAWDYFFSLNKPCVVLIHLKNGKLIGGYCGKKSFTSALPNKKSIYLEKVAIIDDNGVFQEWVTNSEGVIVDGDAFDYVELFNANFNTKEIFYDNK